MNDRPFQSATDQLALLASGQTSSEELLDVYLGRIGAHNFPTLTFPAPCWIARAGKAVELLNSAAVRSGA